MTDKERLEDDKPFYQMGDKEKLNAAKQFVGILIERHVEEGEYHPDQMNAIAWIIEQAELNIEYRRQMDDMRNKIAKQRKEINDMRNKRHRQQTYIRHLKRGTNLS